MSLVKAAEWLLHASLAIVVIWLVLFFAVQVAVALWRLNCEKEESEDKVNRVGK